jgi:hypothetical protein
MNAASRPGLRSEGGGRCRGLGPAAVVRTEDRDVGPSMSFAVA